jgi:hypothetical protein
MERPRISAVLPLSLLVALTTAVRANDSLDGNVLGQVPRDALGIVVVRNLSQVDAKVGKVLGAVGSRLPGPLALLKSIAGLDAGLDLRRELLVVLLPPQNNSRQFHLAVWLPVRDYDALVHSLDGDPGRRIAAVTLAGEDLLMVRQGNWAVVMDTDQRERLEQSHDVKLSPPTQLADWSEWVETLDAAVVVLPAGMRSAWAWAAEDGLLKATPAVALPPQQNDDLFGPANRSSPTVGWPNVRQAIRAALATAPELTRWAAEADGLACGLRLDDDGNALVGLRVAISPDALAAAKTDNPSSTKSAAPRLDSAGPFVIAGRGRVSPHWIRPLVAPYVRQQAVGLTAQYDSKVAPEDLSNLCKSAESAAADVSAFAILTRPGAGGDGVYANSFLAFRVPSSEKFLARAGALVQEWNAMLTKVDVLKLLAFDSRTITVGDRPGQEYTIDMTAAAGGPPLPEIKTAMEKLFGPGGKFRLQFVAIDESTVLLAAATESQVAEVLGAMKERALDAPESGELQATIDLFATENQWQLFFSPRGYTEWMRRYLDAILGDAIGAPVLPQFPESPPIGVAGGLEGRILWTEVAVPIETMRGYAKFSRK